METPPKGDIKSHHVSGLSEDLTPSSSGKDIRETTPEATGGVPAATKQEAGGGGGGVTGYIKSLIGGGGQAETAPHPDQQTTHSQDLVDGTTAAVHTAPESTAVPESLKEGSQPVGAARTQIQQPVSEYASALEGIAGEPTAPDPTAKYGSALGPITGDAPAQGTGTGMVGAVSAAAGSVVQSVKHAVGYEDDPADYNSTAATKSVGQPGDSTQTGATSTGGTGPGIVTPSDLPKSGVVNTDGAGSADITAKEQPGYLSSAAGAVSGAATGLRNTVTGMVGGGTQNAGTGPGTGVSTGTGGSTGAGIGSSGVGTDSTSKPTIEYEDAGNTTTAPAAAGTAPGAAAAGATPGAALSAANANTASASSPASTSTTTPAAATAAKDTRTTGDVKAPAAAADTTSAPTTAAKEEGSSVTAPKSNPPVSAFASDTTDPKDKKTGEIIEDTGAKKASAPATGQGAAATGAAEAKTGATGATKTGEKTGKEKSKCCGLCVIQ